MTAAEARPFEEELPLFTQALDAGTELPGYRVKRLLGAGGFAITYLAEHVAIGNEVAIKEYLPRGIAVRTPAGKVAPISADAAADLAWGLKRFREEARTLGRLKHPNIVPVLNFIEANGTAYAVMEFIAGETLEQRIERGGALSSEEMNCLVPALLAGIEAVHDAGFLHRDIKPSNIMLRRDGTPVLVDFGAARRALSTHGRALTAILSDGYAPYEQYQSDSDQGRWSDIYALGATLYRCVTGEKPVSATSRANARVRGAPDPLVAASRLVAGRYPAALLAAIDRAISLVEAERPQSVAEFRALISGATASAPPAPAAIAEAAPALALGAESTLLAGNRNEPEFTRGSETLVIGAAPAEVRRPQTDRRVWVRRAAIATAVLVLAAGAVTGYRAYEERQAAVAESERAAAAEEKRRTEQEQRRRAAAVAEEEAHAAARRDLDAGRTAVQAQSYDEALRLLAAALGTGKLSVAEQTDAHLARSTAWIGKGDFGRAFAATTEAIIANPESAAAYLQRGRIRWHRQQWDGSLADFNEAIRIDPAAAEAYSLRGIVWYHKGELDRAIADYTEALRLKPDHAEALFDRGLAWHKKGDTARAAEDFRAALRANAPEQVAINARKMLASMGLGE